MKKGKKIILILGLLVFILSGCTNSKSNNKKENDITITITIAAAASLKNCMDDKIIPMFEEKHPNIKVQVLENYKHK